MDSPGRTWRSLARNRFSREVLTNARFPQKSGDRDRCGGRHRLRHERHAPGLVGSGSSSTMPGSAPVQSGRIAGSVHSNSGRSRRISDAASSRSIPRRRWRWPTRWYSRWCARAGVGSFNVTMLAAGSPTGPAKAALEAMSATIAKALDGTGVTVNVLVPGGFTNTPMTWVTSLTLILLLEIGGQASVKRRRRQAAPRKQPHQDNRRS